MSQEQGSSFRRMCCYGALALVGVAWLWGPKTSLLWLTTAGLAAVASPVIARSLKQKEWVALAQRLVQIPYRGCELVAEWYAEGTTGTTPTAGTGAMPVKGNMMSEVSVDVDTCLHFIVRDFVLSWYNALSANSQFSKEVYYVLEDVAVAVRSRLRKIKRYRVARKAVAVYHAYFKQYLRCLEVVDGRRSRCAADVALDAAWASHFPRHVALLSEESELRYLRNVVQVLLEVLTPVDIRTCVSAKKLMVDILARNVLLPLMDLVSNPDWLNGKLIVLLDERPPAAAAARCVQGPTKINSSQSECDDVAGSEKISSAKDEKVAVEDEMELCSKSDASLESPDVFLPEPRDAKLDDADLKDDDNVQQGEDVREEEEQEEEENVCVVDDNGQLHRRSLPSSMSFEHLSSFLSNVREELEKPMEYFSDNFAHYFRTDSASSSASRDGTVAKTNALDLFGIEDSIPGVALLRRRSTSIIEQSHSISQALEGAMTATTGPLMANKLHEYRTQASHEPEFPNDADCVQPSPLPNHVSTVSSSSNTPKPTSKPTEMPTLHLNLKRSLPSGADDVQDALSFESNEDMMLEEAVELSPDNRCFLNLSISLVEVAEEPGGLDHYILYCIQYDAWYLDRPVSENGDAIEQRMILQRTQVKRRFREFITLTHRLDDNPSLKAYVQNIKKPTRPKIPMMNKFDRDMIKDRRLMLEQYLQKLIAIEKIASSCELREFLAYGGDASIAYVTKVSEGVVPRFDKFLAKKVSGMLDKFRLPKPGVGMDEMTRPQLPSKAPERKSFLGIPLGSSDDIQNINVKFGFADNEADAIRLENSMRRSVSETKNEWANGSQSALNMFVDMPTPLSPDRTFTPEEGFPTSHIPTDDSMDGSQFPDDDDDETTRCMMCVDRDIPLASAMIDLGLDGITNKDVWLKKISFVYLLKLIGGSYFEKYLHSKVDEYTTTEKCLHYLRQARDAVWPGGVLPMDPDPTPSVEERAATKAEALLMLREFFPSIIPIFLGADVYDDATQLFFSSLQHPKLLRHLCYSILDLVVETIAPEVKLDSFHTRLANS